jgi:hypothetical protein
VIDLDQPAQYRTPPIRPSERGRRRPATARALILVAVGSFLAGGITAEQADQAESSAVSVLLFAESDLLTVHTEQRRVRMEAQVTVVNAGSAMLNVFAVRVDQPGVTVRSPERQRQIRAGTALPVDVTVEWNCGVDQPETLVASVSVETVDEQVRTISPVTLDGTPWIQSGRGGCASSG